MRTVFLTLIALFVMGLGFSQNPFNLKKDHDAILVRDVDSSARFYKEIFGLKEIPNGGLGDHIRWVELGDKIQLHLIESEEVTQKHKGVHMALSTDDLAAFMKSLKEKGVDFENWPGEKETTNTRPDGIKQIYLQDPDGYWIEINDNRL